MIYLYHLCTIPRAGIGSGDGVLQTLQKCNQKLALGGREGCKAECVIFFLVGIVEKFFQRQSKPPTNVIEIFDRRALFSAL